MPRAYAQLRTITSRLEKHYKDVQDFEFTIQDDNLYMLQTRNGKRTGYAAVVIATDLVAEKLITPKDAVLHGRAGGAVAAPLADLRSEGMEEAAVGDERTAGVAGRGVGSGRLHGRPTRSSGRKQGKKVLLVRKETVPDDIHGMFVAQGILTATGGMTSHAAVVGRQMGKPSVVGAGALVIDEHAKTVKVGATTLKEGEWLSFDGLSRRGEGREGRHASRARLSRSSMAS